MAITSRQVEMINAIGKLEPVSAARLGINDRTFRTFDLLVKGGFVEYAGHGLLGNNWRLTAKGRRFVPVEEGI